MTGSNNALTMPVSGAAPQYRDVAQIVGRDLGLSEWGSAVRHTSFDSDGEYAHTIRNRGTGGALNVLDSASGSSLLSVADSGVVVGVLTASTVNATLLRATSATIATLTGTTANIQTVNATTVNATSVVAATGIFDSLSVGTFSASTIAVGFVITGGLSSGTASFSGPVSLSSSLTVHGTSVFGDDMTDAFIVLAAETHQGNVVFANTAGTATIQFVDATNARVVFGTQTSLTSASNDLVAVRGGRLYVVPQTEAYAIGLRYGPSSTKSFFLGVDPSSPPNLVFSEDGGVQRARLLGDGGMIVGPSTALASTELLRVGGPARVEGTMVVTAGGLIVSASGADVTGTSVFRGAVEVTNAASIYGAESGGTLRNLAKVDGTNNLIYGESGANGMTLSAGLVSIQNGTAEQFRVDSNGVGFFNSAGVVRQSAATAATDLTSAITLVNSLRTGVLAFNLFHT